MRKLFHSWSGKGQLFSGLSAVIDEDGYDWTADDIAKRAHLVLFEQCRGNVVRLPVRLMDWWKLMPVASQAETVVSRSLRGAVDWPKTRRRGWPPAEFTGRVRRRSPDDELLGCLRWTADRLLLVYRDAKKSRANVGDELTPQLSTLKNLANSAEIKAVESVFPDLLIIDSMRRLGSTWRVVADLAEKLRKEDSGDLWRLAIEQLAPDDSIAWRLFHLGILGTVLGVLEELGCRVVSRRPLAGRSHGPAYRVEIPGATAWDLWFEAGDIWNSPDTKEPYVLATSGLVRRGRTKGADIFLVDHKSRYGIVIECKYTAEGDYLRRGYEQALTYLLEARTEFIDSGEAFVVAPIEAAPKLGTGRTLAGSLTFCAPEHLRGLLIAALRSALASGKARGG